MRCRRVEKERPARSAMAIKLLRFLAGQTRFAQSLILGQLLLQTFKLAGHSFTLRFDELGMDALTGRWAFVELGHGQREPRGLGFGDAVLSRVTNHLCQ